MSPKARVSKEAVDILNIIDMCQKFSTLPYAGGLLDQDKLFIYVLQTTLVWKQQREEIDRHRSTTR